MNWIKENKFLAGFLAVMFVGVGALGYLLYTAMDRADQADAHYLAQSNELTRLQTLPVSANQKNLAALVAQKDEAVRAIEAFQATLAAKAFPVETMTPEAFQDKLKATKNAIVEKAAGTAKLPDKFFLGFDSYETRPPDSKDVAAVLGQELKAVEWLFAQLIESHVTEVKSIKRTVLSEESERAKAGEKGGKKAKPPLLTEHPVELVLQCNQSALATFLNTLISPKAPQFYLLRSIRIKNENEKGPPRIDPNASIPSPSAPVPVQPGAPAIAPGVAPAQEAVAKYIVGQEQLEVTLEIEIVNFSAPASAAPAAAAAKE